MKRLCLFGLMQIVNLLDLVLWLPVNFLCCVLNQLQYPPPEYESFRLIKDILLPKILDDWQEAERLTLPKTADKDTLLRAASADKPKERR